MLGKHILVTGASGFIGLNLVRVLVERGAQVSCLVRNSSQIDELKELGCRLVFAEIPVDAAALKPAIEGQDIVFHLAALTNASNRHRQIQVNVNGWENLLVAASCVTSPPICLLVSSLAAVGPSSRQRPHVESDLCQPISNYGRTKLLAEQVAQRFTDRVPISILRPPIVLGPGDREGLVMFTSINRLGVHVIPGFSDHRYSIIHSADLVQALIAVARSGERLDHSNSKGIYFPAADEMPSYRELGELIGLAVGRPRIRVIRIPTELVWGVATVNSMLNSLLKRGNFLNRDKAREVTGGSWTCSNEKIKRDLGWSPAASLAERLQHTALWYRHQQWLPKHPSQTEPRSQKATAIPQ